jgi:hypothetical protein
MVVRERDIRKHHNPPEGFTENFIRGVVERSGVDAGRTMFVRGGAPDREWTNVREMFLPSDAEMAAVKAEQEAAEAVAVAEKARAEAERQDMAKQIAELKDLLNAARGVIAVQEAMEMSLEELQAIEDAKPIQDRRQVLTKDGKPDKRIKEFSDRDFSVKG